MNQPNVMASWNQWLGSDHNAFQLTPNEAAAWLSPQPPPMYNKAKMSEAKRLVRSYGNHAAQLVLQLGEDDNTFRILHEQADWFCTLVETSIADTREAADAVQAIRHLRDQFCMTIRDTLQERRIVQSSMAASDFLPSYCEEMEVQLACLLDALQ